MELPSGQAAVIVLLVASPHDRILAERSPPQSLGPLRSAVTPFGWPRPAAPGSPAFAAFPLRCAPGRAAAVSCRGRCRGLSLSLQGLTPCVVTMGWTHSGMT